jgi:orotate phosphoribosyltransferase
MITNLPSSHSLIDFLVRTSVIKFGSFKTKSGRTSPYFLNFGAISTGSELNELAEHYIAALHVSQGIKPNVVFGPTYKGIPLAIAITGRLPVLNGEEMHFSFNRKESKNHGEKGILVGRQLMASDRVIIVEDVVSAGTTLKEIVPLLRNFSGLSIEGMIITVDRQEKISEADTKTAVPTLSEKYNFPIISLLTISDIVHYLCKPNSSNFTLTVDQVTQIKGYLEQYGDGLSL